VDGTEAVPEAATFLARHEAGGQSAPPPWRKQASKRWRNFDDCPGESGQEEEEEQNDGTST
jgi:hypothetical protein